MYTLNKDIVISLAKKLTDFSIIVDVIDGLANYPIWAKYVTDNIEAILTNDSNKHEFKSRSLFVLPGVKIVKIIMTPQLEIFDALAFHSSLKEATFHLLIQEDKSNTVKIHFEHIRMWLENYCKGEYEEGGVIKKNNRDLKDVNFAFEFYHPYFGNSVQSNLC